MSEVSPVQSNGDGQDGNGTSAAIQAGHGRAPTPEVIRELAEACVKFVKTAVGVTLDYTPETLPILDHYLEEGRAAARARPETATLIAHAAGAYFGEVVRRSHASWWRTEGGDPAFYRIELEAVFLSFSPVQLIADALLRPDEIDVIPSTMENRETDSEHPVDEAPSDAAIERIEVAEEDRQAVEERLGELPAVSEREFYAPSTRLEVIDITVDAIRARRMGAGQGDGEGEGSGDGVYTPDDYDA